MRHGWCSVPTKQTSLQEAIDCGVASVESILPVSHLRSSRECWSTHVECLHLLTTGFLCGEGMRLGNSFMGTVFLNPTLTDLRLLGGREQAGVGRGVSLWAKKEDTTACTSAPSIPIHTTAVRTGGGARPSSGPFLAPCGWCPDCRWCGTLEEDSNSLQGGAEAPGALPWEITRPHRAEAVSQRCHLLL